MDYPGITLVMPSFNQARYLEEAMRSILDQEYPNLEFMVLDGGSTDGSREIIERYSPRLAYWRSEPDGGQSEAIIRGFARARGELWGWVNSDDVLLPGALEALARAFRANPSGGLFGGHYMLMDQASRVIRCKRHPANAGWFARYGIFAFNPPGSLFRRQEYEGVGGLRADLHYAMDNDLYIRMIANGARYVHLDRYLSMFRLHTDQKTSAHRRQAQTELRRLYEELWQGPLSRFAQQRRWRYLFRLWQLLNGNYVRMELETLKWRGHHWKSLAAGSI